MNGNGFLRTVFVTIREHSEIRVNIKEDPRREIETSICKNEESQLSKYEIIFDKGNEFIQVASILKIFIITTDIVRHYMYDT